MSNKRANKDDDPTDPEGYLLVILIGAIGGMILSGIVGLFVGAVFLAVLYHLYVKWLEQETVNAEADA